MSQQKRQSRQSLPQVSRGGSLLALTDHKHLRDRLRSIGAPAGQSVPGWGSCVYPNALESGSLRLDAASPNPSDGRQGLWAVASQLEMRPIQGAGLQVQGNRDPALMLYIPIDSGVHIIMCIHICV